MSFDPVSRTARRPRYGLAARVQAEVEQVVDGVVRQHPCEVQDLSRDGFQIRTADSLVAQAPITLRLLVGGSPLECELSGVVRWQRSTADDAWLAGCQSERPMDWETLGELFLTGVLSSDAP